MRGTAIVVCGFFEWYGEGAVPPNNSLAGVCLFTFLPFYLFTFLPLYHSVLMLSIGLDNAVFKVHPMTETKATSRVKAAPAIKSHHGKSMR